MAIARRQLRALMANELNLPRTVETQLQLGLLAAQVAVAERLPALVAATQPPEFAWDLPRLERFVQALAPNARRAVQLLCDEGGSATPARMHELTGAKSMAGMTTSIRRAAVHAAPGILGPQLAVVGTVSADNQQAIARYRIDPDILPLLREALTRHAAR